jgi:steroid delta-isomerase-like uncharacterized protein
MVEQVGGFSGSYLIIFKIFKGDHMSVQENKAIMQRYYDEAWNQGKLSVLDEIVSADYVNHSPAVPGLPPGPEGLKPIVAAFRTGFPDVQFTIEELIAEGDKVVTRWTMRGTHKGEFMGIPATDKQVHVTGIQVECIQGGKIVEHWRQSDDLSMLQQLGAIPASSS